MKLDLNSLIRKGETIAVACSGGSDSMALLHYMQSKKDECGIKIICINVEHGIRGESSISDSAFVARYCNENSVPFFPFSVNSIENAEKKGLSVEESARSLRYQVFFDCVKNGLCDKVATAHHRRDNAESVLINLLRGSGIKGVSGIEENFENRIIRPFLRVSKQEIEEYIRENDVPFVTDESNFSSDYTRNFLRLKIFPLIKEIFPEAEKNIERFSVIAKEENDFLNECAKNFLTVTSDCAAINISAPKAAFKRAAIFAMKALGIEKDWEKTHIDDAYSLVFMKNGSSINLPKGIVAIKEYDNVVFYAKTSQEIAPFAFCEGERNFFDKTLCVLKTDIPLNPKSGLFVDKDKIPKDAVIRQKKDGDKFTKFGGGTKKLNDYLTDLKIPLKDRPKLAVIAKDDVVYAIFGVAVSELSKIDQSTQVVYELSIK